MDEDCDKQPEPDTSTKPASEEQVRLADLPTARDSLSSPRSRNHWVARLCSCLYPQQRRRRQNYLLPPQLPKHFGLPTVVLDLDETLVHSFELSQGQADFTVQVKEKNWAVKCRPYAAEFLQKVSKLYEVVVFTASLSCYADKIIDALDAKHCVAFRLFREDCSDLGGILVKDLQRLGRDLHRIVIVDVCCRQNSPTCYLKQPDNALPVESWFGDQKDQELLQVLKELESLAGERDVRINVPGAAARLLQQAARRARNRRGRPATHTVPPSPSTHPHLHPYHHGRSLCSALDNP